MSQYEPPQTNGSLPTAVVLTPAWPRLRWALYGVLLVGALIATMGYDQALAYNGDGVDIPGLPQGITVGMRTYPWFYDSIWPSVTAFALGVLVIIVALTGLRLISRPRFGGKMMWIGVGIAGIGIVFQFAGIAVDATTDTGVGGFFLSVVGVFTVVCAALILCAGLAVSGYDLNTHRRSRTGLTPLVTSATEMTRSPNWFDTLQNSSDTDFGAGD